ncbi:probable transmembrane protein 128 [Coccomyxa sp. Obi]|nr:probable transmembrane protein 128 [Coccomyxa sp. Obi]
MGKHKGASLQTQNGASSSSLQTLDKPKREDRKIPRSPPSLKQRIWATIEASLWVIGAISAAIYGDGQYCLPELLLYDKRIRRVSLYVGLGFLLVNFLFNVYLRLWLQWLKGIEDWWKSAPIATPLATFCGLCAGVAFTVALWPALRYTAPFMVAVVFMGFIMAPHLLPSKLFLSPKKTGR